MKRLLLFLPAAAIILCIGAYAAPASAQYQYSPYTYPYNEYPLGRDPYPYDPYFQPYAGSGYPYDNYYPYDEYEEYPEFSYPGFYGGYWSQPHEEQFGAHEHFEHGAPGHGVPGGPEGHGGVPGSPGGHPGR